LFSIWLYYVYVFDELMGKKNCILYLMRLWVKIISGKK
jgi:hypothetical protein